MPSTELDIHIANTKYVHGVKSGTVCGTDLTQTLTNKTISGGTITGASITNCTISGVVTTLDGATINGATLTGTITTTGATFVGLRPKILQKVYISDSNVTNITAGIPPDGTIPQKTEGTEWKTLAITPTNTDSTLHFHANIYIGSSTANKHGVAAIFSGTTTAAFYAVNHYVGNNVWVAPLVLDYSMAAGGIAETTYKIRVGANDATSITINGYGGATMLGTPTVSTFSIEEIAP